MNTDFRTYSVMKDSGLVWLGDVPKHWEVRRLKYLLRERDNRSAEGKETLLSVSQYSGINARNSDDRTEESDTRADSLVGYKLVAPDDLVINIMLAWNGSLGVSPLTGVCSPAYCVYYFNPNAVPQYYHNLLRSSQYKARIKTVSTGIVESRLRLYTDDLYRLEALLPPRPEQTAIVRFLDHADNRIQRYIRAKQKLLTLLEEQKQGIIHQAVTGQINVRTGEPYPAYKDSGVEWLGDVPEHWEVRKLKTICSMKSGEGITAMSIKDNGKYPVYGGNGVRGYTSNFTHCGDFALIGRQGALCGNIHIARGKFWASEHAVVATLSHGHVLDWFAPMLKVMNLNQYSIAAAQPGLAVDRILDLHLAVPPQEEQVMIACYVQKRIASIDTIASRTHRQIELVQEYRTRLIADVVTGKLDVRETVVNLPD